MIFSYLTRCYFRSAVLFLKSFKRFNGDQEFIYLTAVGLASEEIATLYSLYANMYVDVKEYIDLGIPHSYEEERRCFAGEKNTSWMKYVADEHRIREFKTVVDQYYYSYYIFLDIDLLFRGNILELASSCDDVTITYRRGKKDSGKFAIGFIVFPRRRTYVIGRWLNEIQSTLLEDREAAHGQLAFYNTIDVFAPLPQKYLDKTFSSDSVVWTPNRGNREVNYQKFLIECFNGKYKAKR